MFYKKQTMSLNMASGKGTAYHSRLNAGFSSLFPVDDSNRYTPLEGREVGDNDRNVVIKIPEIQTKISFLFHSERNYIFFLIKFSFSRELKLDWKASNILRNGQMMTVNVSIVERDGKRQ